MTFNEFKTSILKGIEGLPKNWRYGQKVFNYVEEYFGVAREVQFARNVDCFYNNDLVNEFIVNAYDVYMNKTNE